MVFNLEQARNNNTENIDWVNYPSSFFRVFIDDKLFISDDGRSFFPSGADARAAFYDSTYWKKVSEYIDFCQQFFNKTWDDDWRGEFEERVIERMKITMKEYVERDNY